MGHTAGHLSVAVRPSGKNPNQPTWTAQVKRPGSVPCKPEGGRGVGGGGAGLSRGGGGGKGVVEGGGGGLG